MSPLPRRINLGPNQGALNEEQMAMELAKPPAVSATNEDMAAGSAACLV
jgi:hypothetical protein